jgi:hypothetical protein
MAYYLGRDVVVALTTEDDQYGIGVTAAGGLQTPQYNEGPDSGTNVFAGPRARYNVLNKPNTNFAADTTVFGTQEPSDGIGSQWSNEQSDITGVDISLGVQDEDITYVGIKTAMKVEIKKETTLSITRKKSSNVYGAIFNAARHGVLANGQYHENSNPARSDYGFRVFLKLKTDGQVLTLPQCCVQSHSITVNADGTTEETIEFMSYLQPLITLGTTGTDNVTANTSF